MKNYWTKRELRRLEQLYRKGLKIREIAEKLHRTPGAVQARLSRNPAIARRRSFRPWSQKEVQKMQTLAASGKTVKEIAKRLKRDKSYVYKKLRQMNTSFKREKRPFTDEEIETILSKINDGVSVSDVAKELGRSRVSIYKVLKRKNVSVPSKKARKAENTSEPSKKARKAKNTSEPPKKPRKEKNTSTSSKKARKEKKA